MTIEAMSRRILTQVREKFNEGWDDRKVRLALRHTWPSLTENQINKYVGVARSKITSERVSWEPTMIEMPSRSFLAWSRYHQVVPMLMEPFKVLLARVMRMMMERRDHQA